MPTHTPPPGSARRTSAILTTSLLLCLLSSSVKADFKQTTGGPHDYNAASNWDNDTINGTWSKAISGQTVYFAADTLLTTGWTFNFKNSNLTLRGEGVDRTVTLNGDVSMAASGRTTTVGSTSTTAGQRLNIELGGNRTFTVGSADTLSFLNTISGQSYGIIKEGAGMLSLGASTGFSGNTFTGALQVNAGTLRLVGANNSTPLTYSGAISMADGTTLAVQANGTNQSSSVSNINTGTISLSGVATLAVTGGASNRYAKLGGVLRLENDAVLNVGFGTQNGIQLTANGGVVLNGNNHISVINANSLNTSNKLIFGPVAQGVDGSSLTISASSELAVILSGANTYTGATTISAGTLALGSSASLASTELSIASGAGFDVSSKTGGYSLANISTTIYLNELSNGIIRIGADKTLALGGSELTLNFTTAELGSGTTYDLFDLGATSGDFGSVTIAGTFSKSLVQSGSLWTGTTGLYDFSFDQSTGSLTVAASAIPEPSTYAAIAGALALGAVAWRRRRPHA